MAIIDNSYCYDNSHRGTSREIAPLERLSVGTGGGAPQ